MADDRSGQVYDEYYNGGDDDGNNNNSAMDMDASSSSLKPMKKKQKVIDSNRTTASAVKKRKKAIVKDTDDGDDDDDGSDIDDILKEMLQADKNNVDDVEQQEDNPDESDKRNSAAVARRLGATHLLGDTEVDMQIAADDEEEDGEDLLENAEKDYEDHEELDEYDEAEFDTKDYEPLSLEARRAAEAIMRERDRSSTKLGGVRVPKLLGGDDDDKDEESDDEEAQLRRERMERGDENVEPSPISLEQLNLPVPEMVQRPEVVAQIKREYYDFLKEYIRDASQADGLSKIDAFRNKIPIYITAIREMVSVFNLFNLFP